MVGDGVWNRHEWVMAALGRLHRSAGHLGRRTPSESPLSALSVPAGRVSRSGSVPPQAVRRTLGGKHTWHCVQQGASAALSCCGGTKRTHCGLGEEGRETPWRHWRRAIEAPEPGALQSSRLLLPDVSRASDAVTVKGPTHPAEMLDSVARLAT